MKKVKKVRSFNEIANHDLVDSVDSTDFDPTEIEEDRNPILISLKRGWKCTFNDCGIISATSKRDAIMKFNSIYFCSKLYKEQG